MFSFLHIPAKRPCDRPVFVAYYQIAAKFGAIACGGQTFRTGGENSCKALEILDHILPNNVEVDGGVARHHRLIHSCMKDLLLTGQAACSELVDETFVGEISGRTLFPHRTVVDIKNLVWKRSVSWAEDPRLLLLELQKRDLLLDESTVSWIISSARATEELHTGVQLHACVIKVGFDKLVTVGSSLISLYSKLKQLSKAYHAFENIPANNTVSWTAIIACYAQEWKVETCMNLFSLMRRSGTKPNDFTFSSLLSACTNDASLGLGRWTHSLVTKIGFEHYLHVSNALISMYAKCGSISEACLIFEKMSLRDHISWNSMIFGYAEHGFAKQALSLLKEMDKQGWAADRITYLGVLSMFRHAGLVEEGRKCFDLMLELGVKPDINHYSCIVDLLGRVGLLVEALEFITNMPIPPNAVIWGSLLSSAKVHGSVWIGIKAAESRLLLEPGCAATHVQLANLYASIGCWNHAARARKLMKDRSLKTVQGYSWIEIGGKVYRFTIEDKSNTEIDLILAILDLLSGHLKHFYHISDFDTDFNAISGW